MIFHENRLPSDDFHEISCLICYFWNSGKIWNCRLLKIVGGALRVNTYPTSRLHLSSSACLFCLCSHPLGAVRSGFIVFASMVKSSLEYDHTRLVEIEIQSTNIDKKLFKQSFWLPFFGWKNVVFKWSRYARFKNGMRVINGLYLMPRYCYLKS